MKHDEGKKNSDRKIQPLNQSFTYKKISQQLLQNNQINIKKLEKFIIDNDIQCLLKYSQILQQQEYLTLLNKFKIQQYRKFQPVFKYGEKGDIFYIILEGQVCVLLKTLIKQSNDSQQFIINDLYPQFGIHVTILPGQSFGEFALLEKVSKKRTATIVCKSDCVFLTLNARDFNIFLQKIERKKFQQIVIFFKKMSFFQHVRYQKLKQLIGFMKKTTYYLGQKIYEQGSPSDQIYFIIFGLADIVKKIQFYSFHSNTKFRKYQKKLKTLLPSDFFGIQSLNQQQLHQHSIHISSQKFQCYIIKLQSIIKILGEDSNTFIDQLQIALDKRNNYLNEYLKQIVNIQSQKKLINVKQKKKSKESRKSAYKFKWLNKIGIHEFKINNYKHILKSQQYLRKNSSCINDISNLNIQNKHFKKKINDLTKPKNSLKNSQSSINQFFNNQHRMQYIIHKVNKNIIHKNIRSQIRVQKKNKCDLIFSKINYKHSKKYLPLTNIMNLKQRLRRIVKNSDNQFQKIIKQFD